jgi:hypothetical protein
MTRNAKLLKAIRWCLETASQDRIADVGGFETAEVTG